VNKIKIRKTGGYIYLPDTDTHFIQYAEIDAYQAKTYKLSLCYVENYSRALDVGAHVGFFSRRMLLNFDHVESFEPNKDNLECLKLNAPRANTHNVAIGDIEGDGSLDTPLLSNSGAWEVTRGDGDTEIKTIDSYCYDDVGLIKVDAQGMDYDVLIGAKDTIEQCKPVIIIEIMMNGKKDKKILKLLRSLGYKYIEKQKDVVAWFIAS